MFTTAARTVSVVSAVLFHTVQTQAWVQAPPPPTSGCPGRHRRHFTAALLLITGELLQAALIITPHRDKTAHASDSEGPSRALWVTPPHNHTLPCFTTRFFPRSSHLLAFWWMEKPEGFLGGWRLASATRLGWRENLHRSIWVFWNITELVRHCMGCNLYAAQACCQVVS